MNHLLCMSRRRKRCSSLSYTFDCVELKDFDAQTLYKPPHNDELGVAVAWQRSGGLLEAFEIFRFNMVGSGISDVTKSRHSRPCESLAFRRRESVTCPSVVSRVRELGLATLLCARRSKVTTILAVLGPSLYLAPRLVRQPSEGRWKSKQRGNHGSASDHTHARARRIAPLRRPVTPSASGSAGTVASKHEQGTQECHCRLGAPTRSMPSAQGTRIPHHGRKTLHGELIGADLRGKLAGVDVHG